MEDVPNAIPIKSSDSSLASVEDGSSTWKRRAKRRQRRLLSPPRPSQSPPVVITTAPSGRGPQCHLCKQQHWLEVCPKFLKWSIDERLEYLNRCKRCTRCTMNHGVSDCRAKVRCFLCLERHDSSLHDAFHPRLRS